MAKSKSTYSNRILAALPAADLTRLAPHLEPFPLTVRTMIEHLGESIPYIVFPLSGLVSIVAQEGEYQLEVGIVGREGMTGTTVILGLESAPQQVFVQVAGDAVRMATPEFKRAIADRPSLLLPFLAYVQALLQQTAQTALANGRCTLEERLARWLLMTQDRVDSEDIPLTHEFLSVMLGVRRPGVTVALQKLEGDRAIKNERGLVTILNRSHLEDLAGGAYSPPPWLGE